MPLNTGHGLASWYDLLSLHDYFIMVQCYSVWHKNWAVLILSKGMLICLYSIARGKCDCVDFLKAVSNKLCFFTGIIVQWGA